MKKSLTATIAMAKQPNETMTQALHRLKNSGESITQTAARLARGDIDAEVITAPENPTTATGENTDPVKATLTPANDKPVKVNIEATGSVEKSKTATKPKAKPVAKKKTTTTKPKAKTTTKKKTTVKDK